MRRAVAEPTKPAAEDPDRLQGFSTPREVETVFGHDAPFAEFAAGFESGRLHHAWLIVGPEGVGKATLAYRMARLVLSGGDDKRAAGTVFGKVAALSHPNLLLLRRPYDEKKKRYLQSISVDEVRRLREFLGLTAGVTGWRVVIVDRADELNQSAANALLKSLEEPPQRTVFFLVATADGRIPVTIRSRARLLRVTALTPADLEAAVSAALARDGKTVDADTLATALALSQGSARRALELATGEGIGLYRDLLKHLDQLPRLDGPGIHRLAERVGGYTDTERLELFYSLLLGVLERMIRTGATGEGGIAEENALAGRLLAPADLSRWVEAWEAIGKAKADASSLNLDRNLLVLETFHRLQQVASGSAAQAAS